MGVKCWKVKRKLREVIPEVSSWIISKVDYTEMDASEGTWFIDPPYANEAGKRYRQGGIDYAILSDYCKTRKGQVIVCENYGADWLKFERFNHQRVSIRSKYQKANAQEVMWYRET